MRISHCGDAWLPEVSDDKIGESVIVTRTNFADKLMNDLNKENILKIEKINHEKIIQSQILNLKFKKLDLETRIKLLKRIGYETPTYIGLQKYGFSVLGLLRGTYAFVNIKLSSTKIFRRILKHIPFPFFRLYFGIYKILSII